MSVTAFVPVKRFFVAKRRLAPVMSAEARSRLGQDLASHTVTTIAAAGADPVVLAADEEVASWAKGNNWPAQVDAGSGLSGATTAATTSRGDDPWLVIHADLPLLIPEDISLALEVLAAGRSPLAPSNDGGSALIGGRGPFDFSYGPASFHRHLPRLGEPAVLVRLGLILDLDEPSDFHAARSHLRGAWLRQYAPSS